MMRFFVDLYEETMDAPAVLYMRRTGPYGPDNAVLMERFKAWLKEQRLYGEDTVILAVPLDDPHAAEAQACRYDVCIPYPTGMAVPTDAVDSRRLDGGKYAVF